jgi:phosphatidylethanolamine/phosphatidyl-N-methylethanolamine N-methyltransferase
MLAMSLAEKMSFLSEFLRRPASVGAIAPSSPSLAEKMLQWIDWPNVQAVIEYGPGTGAFTGRIRDYACPGCRLLAVEINPQFAATLRSRYPDVRVYEDSVTNVEAICRRDGIGQVDAVVCGLPWAVFGEQQQAAILRGLMTVLRPGGQFATFAYLQGLLLPAARRFRKNLDRHFSRVERSPTAWRNLPPAFVYRCCR